mgnify:CR=1 FL=1
MGPFLYTEFFAQRVGLDFYELVDATNDVLRFEFLSRDTDHCGPLTGTRCYQNAVVSKHQASRAPNYQNAA